jgi:hypothetical protein
VGGRHLPVTADVAESPYEESLAALASTIRAFKDGPVYTADATEAARAVRESAKPLRGAINRLNDSFKNLSDRRVELLVKLLQDDQTDPLICTLQAIENFQWLDLRKLLMLPLTAIISAWQQTQVDAATIDDIRRQRKEWDAVLASIADGIIMAKGQNGMRRGISSTVEAR